MVAKTGKNNLRNYQKPPSKNKVQKGLNATKITYIQTHTHILHVYESVCVSNRAGKKGREDFWSRGLGFWLRSAAKRQNHLSTPIKWL